MDQKAGAQISTRAFIQSALILFVIILLAGVLTLLVPAGTYQRVLEGERELIIPGSFELVDNPDYPIWRWFTAPVEVLWGPDAVIIITIIVFILMVGASFAILDHSGILKAGIARIVTLFGGRKYLLLLVISFALMSLGAFFGIFEEVVPLVPVMLALSYYLGWDALVGLGMSILATNMGFSAAITNPFTIGVAQRLAGLPLFSGSGLRVFIFLVVYIIFAIFLYRYAKRIERNPEASLVYEEDQAERAKYANLDMGALATDNPKLARASLWFLGFVVLIVAVLVAGPFIPTISDFALPLVGLLFLLGGVGAGMIAGGERGSVRRALWEGLTGIAPGILLILMAVSVKHIIVEGGIMDTILNTVATSFSQTSPFLAAILIYVLALVIEFFVASGSAKAFLLMPILLPLADLIGVTRQLTVTAYAFGDGFSNLIYPTNPVLLISLGLTVVSFPKWLRWTLPLWFWIILVTVVFLGIGVAIGYGPF
ncbi:MAG: YfcC family protein [Chloroflexi bacterium]|nr:MAG: YfcC family protein [Chloroflexota bacterium]MBL1195629.1 YfcC family protein [Chloroflexota bacterium]NOH12917.1 YfcC family protein [Chloroflexota bacterium]